MELMVALTGGLALTAAVFMFTRDMTRFFQRQMKLSEATLSAVTGFERLRIDIARAGYMSSPNLARDARRCPKPGSGGVALAPAQIGGQLVPHPGITEMGLLRLVQGDTASTYSSNYIIANNGSRFDPDQIILWGNYTTAEQFPIQDNDAANSVIHLSIDTNAMSRLGIPTIPADIAADEATLSTIFPPGSMLRVTTGDGREQYAILDDPSVSFSIHPLGLPSLLLDSTVGLITKRSINGGLCGIRGRGASGSVNPVNIIRYELRDLSGDTNYARFFDADLAAPAYDGDRLELVRVEMLSNMTDAPNSVELVAEYAVDLKFGLTVNTNVLTGVNTYLGEDDANLINYADIPWGTPSGQVGSFGPHLIRGVHARLAIRTREANERGYILQGAALTAANSEDLYRVEVAAGQFAKLRSLRAHIATRNSRRESWN